VTVCVQFHFTDLILSISWQGSPPESLETNGKPVIRHRFQALFIRETLGPRPKATRHRRSRRRRRTRPCGPPSDSAGPTERAHDTHRGAAGTCARGPTEGGTAHSHPAEAGRGRARTGRVRNPPGRRQRRRARARAGRFPPLDRPLAGRLDACRAVGSGGLRPAAADAQLQLLSPPPPPFPVSGCSRADVLCMHESARLLLVGTRGSIVQIVGDCNSVLSL
jgi:hypothetical protein